MRPRPKRIRRSEEGFVVSWNDQHESRFSYGYLRSQCPCAECRNRPPRVVLADDPLKLIDDVPIYADDAQLVGNYAIKISWNDGHSHGIYAFDYLRALCPCDECGSGTRGQMDGIS